MPLTSMGCAVQLFKSRDRYGTWTEHATNDWYIQTLIKHYQCNINHIKKVKSKRISDTLLFKHKHITQPTLTQAGTICKAINDPTHTLKGRKNLKRIAQIEALEKLMSS